MNQNQTIPNPGAHAELVFPVKYRHFRGDPIFSNHFNVGRSRDLSLNNLLLAVGRHNSVNSNLDMEFEFAQGESAYVVGKVVEGLYELINGVVHHFDRIIFAHLDEDAENLIVKQINHNHKKTIR